MEDIASQSSGVFAILRDPIPGVQVFPGSADTLVKRGEITNYRSIVQCIYSVKKIAVKNCQTGLMCVKVTVCYICSRDRQTVYIIR